MAGKKKKKTPPKVIKDFIITYQGKEMHIYVLENDDWVIECELGVPDIRIFGNVRAYAEAEGFVDDLT